MFLRLISRRLPPNKDLRQHMITTVHRIIIYIVGPNCPSRQRRTNPTSMHPNPPRKIHIRVLPRPSLRHNPRKKREQRHILERHLRNAWLGREFMTHCHWTSDTTHTHTPHTH